VTHGLGHRDDRDIPSRHIHDPLAAQADQVVVGLEPGVVADGRPRVTDLLQDPRPGERLEGPVDGGASEPRPAAGGDGVDLVGGGVGVQVEDRLQDRPPRLGPGEALLAAEEPDGLQSPLAGRRPPGALRAQLALTLAGNG
jgi:hypothetical protein